MPEAPLQMTVIVPAYKPGDGINRVIESIDAQTLPTDQFEVIIIDDGSPDDTFERLTEYAATRPHLRVERIENSGWPSRPRNIATRMARGEYVLYMDHDDSLFPDALRRAAEFARKTSADVLNVKETKTSDAWWCMPALLDGNSADLKQKHRLDRMLPMVPHKVYRRQFLLDNDITYPEGRRMLWEDIYFNVEAYAKADVIAILADTPFYVWHSSDTNNSKSYGPLDTEYWDRLDALMAFIDRTLDSPDLVAEHRSALLHQYQGRVLGRLGKALQNATPEQTLEAVARARSLQDRFIPRDWDTGRGPWQHVRAAALRANRPDLLAAVHRVYRAFSARVEATDVRWVGGVLEIDARSVWHGADGEPLTFERRADRIGMPLPAEFGDLLGEPWIDVTDALDAYTLSIGTRSRTDKTMWQLPLERRLVIEDLDDTHVRLAIEAHARFDPATVACGAAAAAEVWDVLCVTRWSGLGRAGRVQSGLRAQAALIEGRPAVSYRSLKGALTIDLDQQLRSVVSDGGAPEGSVRTSGDGFVLDLPDVAVTGNTRLPVAVVLCGDDGSPRAGASELPAQLIGENGTARLEVSASVPEGTARLAFRTDAGLVKSRYLLAASRSTLTLSRIVPAPPAPVRRSVGERARAALGQVRRRLRGH